MKATLTFLFIAVSMSSFGQSLDTLKIKTELNGEWNLQYYLDSKGKKNYLSLSSGYDAVDSLKIIQRLAFDDYQLKLTEWVQYKPHDILELNGAWSFGDLPDVISIILKSPHFFLDGLYVVKSISDKQLILTQFQSAREGDIELFFDKK
ncbi:MAG: hypothetical protein HRT58_10620 [Crocinitomicaceae bacterium]|nr:hypothetical protein [Flavobacteriales bacterium]NQZ36107.1 hypothetical protein [Crocinitomicaceae bacterium]